MSTDGAKTGTAATRLWQWMHGRAATTPNQTESSTSGATGATGSSGQEGVSGPDTRETSTRPAATGAGAGQTRLGSIELHPEPGRERWTRRALRTLIVAAALLLVLIGLRTLLRPYPKPEPVLLPATLNYDRGAAQAVAARWAEAYLTLPDDGNSAQDSVRAALLAQDTASNVDTSARTTVTAAQSVQLVLPGAVDIDPDGRNSIVTVLARIKTTDQAPRWLALAVPIGTDGSRPVVTGTAAFVAMPAPGPVAAAGGAASADSPVTAATRDRAAAWFAAYGDDDAEALNGISAPGAQLAPIGGLTLKSVDAWQVNTGSPEIRTATATVTWETPSGRLQQTYQLTLSAVRAGTTTDWRVLTVTAGTQR